MTYNQVIKHYGSPSVLAAKFGITKQRVDQWRQRKTVPKYWQKVFSQDSEGKLKLSKGVL